MNLISFIDKLNKSSIRFSTKTSFGAYSFNGKAGTGQIWLDDVSCIGSENYLKNCSHDGWGYHNCGHNEDISVGCVEEGSYCFKKKIIKELFVADM